MKVHFVDWRTDMQVTACGRGIDGRMISAIPSWRAITCGACMNVMCAQAHGERSKRERVRR